MARWEPDARRRLQEAALDLIAARGYDDVTAKEIAAAAGVTERTFFRHFVDKREAVFGNEARLEAAIVKAATEGGIRAGLRAAAADLQPRQEQLQVFAELLTAHPPLRERDLAKQAALAAAVAVALDDELAGEVLVAVLRVGFTRWLAEGGDLATLLEATLARVPSVR